MTIATGNFPELLWPGIAALFGNKYADYETLWGKIFDTHKSDKRFEKVQGVTRLPLASIKSEGEKVDYTDPMQGFQKEYSHVVYALGVTITREMVEDEQYRYISGAPDWLARSMRHTEEVVCFNVLNNGYTAGITGADGSTLISTTHAKPPGGTFSNRLSVDSDLTQTSFETMLTEIQQATDDHGLQIRILPKTLVVHPSNNFRAVKLLGTPNVTESNNNDINPIMGMCDLVVSPWLTDTDGWWIITDVPEGLTFFRRRNTEVARDNDFDTENLKIKATGRWSVSWTDPRGVYGTPGA